VTADNKKSLGAVQQRIWDVARSIADKESYRQIVILSFKGVNYLFVKQYGLEGDAKSIYSKESKMVPTSLFKETVRDAGFDGLRYVDLNFELFSVKGIESQDKWLRETLKNISFEVSLVKLTKGSDSEIESTHSFPSILGASDRSGGHTRRFFRSRRISVGNYTISALPQHLLAAAFNPLMLKEYARDNRAAHKYFEFVEQHPYSNSLLYVADKNHFEFFIALTDDSGEGESSLVSKIKLIMDFVFRDVESYFTDEGDEAAVARALGYSDEEYEIINEAFIGPWPDDIETESLLEDWVWPESISIRLLHMDIDPSRGTPDYDSITIQDFHETRSGWSRTNFAKIEPSAYLERLKQQHKKHKEANAVVDMSIELAIPIEELDLTVRSYNCLKREGINTVGELIKLGEEEWGSIKNLGSKQVDEILEKLVSGGLGYLIRPSEWPFEEEKH
jgi:hypothetical protein